MDFSIPYNGDLKLIESLKKKDEYSIKTVYGKMYQDIIGGGRARYDFANYSQENLKQAIEQTHEIGAEFNYLLNSPCSSNAEFEIENDIIKMVDNLVTEYKIDAITIANPFLLKLLKKHFPKLKYSVSIISKVDSLEKVHAFEDAGANEITLDYNIYRNFQLLERIKKNSSINFQLLANDGYIFNCPWSMYHFQLEGHDSQKGNNNLLKYFSYCRFNCKEKVAEDNSELIKGMWIRPEDIHYYEDIGYKKFKIIDRLKETDWLINVINAYFNRSYTGNLSDILCSFDTYQKEVINTPKINIDDINVDNIQDLKKYWDLKPYIDNKKLTELNFLEFFTKNKNDCRKIKCSDCKYCEEVASHVLKIDKSNMSNVVFNLKAVKAKMVEILKNDDRED